MTVENVADTATADDECRDCGYEPELKRTLGPFQVFAISFAFISVAVGIFATYDDVLQNAGPVGIWLWIIAAVGQTLVALVVAQFAGSTILPALTYGAIVVLYLAVRKRLERKEGGFSLGRFELPVAIAALVWVAFALFVLVTPGGAFVPDLIVIGLILAGGVYFAKMLIFNREVLDTEPGVDIFAAAPEATK
jgi:amino acid transporter